MRHVLKKKRIDYLIGTPLLMVCAALARLMANFSQRDLSPVPRGRITVCKLLGGGSLILAFPLLLGVRKKYPNCELHLVTTRAVLPFAELLGIFTTIQLIDDRSLWSIVTSSLKTLREIRRSDLHLDLEVFSKLSSVFAFLADARVRVSFYCDELFLRKYVSTHLVFYNRLSAQPDFYRQIGTLLAAPLASLEECRAQFEKNLPLHQPSDERVLAIGHGSSEHLRERCLSSSQWRMIAERFLEVDRPSRIVLLGGAADFDAAEQIRKAFESFALPIENLCGRLSLGESAAVLHASTTFWGVDSALLHIARLLGVPTRSFWGPTDPQTRLVALPGQHDDIHYKKILCSPCVHTTEIPPCGGKNLCIKNLFEKVPEEEIFQNTIVRPERSPAEWPK